MIAAHFCLCGKRAVKKGFINMKKFLSILLSVVMAVTTMAALAVSASAIDLFPDASAAKSGKEYEFMIKADTPKDFKITLSKKGTLDLKISHTVKTCLKVYVMTPDGEGILPSSGEEKQGDYYTRKDYTDCYKNDSTGIFSGTLSYTLLKGTYYIRLKDMSAGTVSITPTYPSTASTEKKVSYLSATLKKGSTLQLGAVLSDGKAGTAEWSSSKSSVASVTSKGKITAKAKGTAVITAKVGTSTVKIQIKVTE